MERLLRVLIAVNAAVLILLVAGAVAFGVVGGRLISEIRARQRAVEQRMSQAQKATDDRIREFTNRRSALEPLASGPMGKLDQEIRLMQLMADEQLAIIEQFGSVREEMRPAAAARRPNAPVKAKKRR